MLRSPAVGDPLPERRSASPGELMNLPRRARAPRQRTNQRQRDRLLAYARQGVGGYR